MSTNTSSAYSKLSKKDRALYDKNELQRNVDRMKRDPEYRKKIETRAKRAEEKDLIRKVKNKGHMTHGSKYQKITPGMINKLREGPLYK